MSVRSRCKYFFLFCFLFLFAVVLISPFENKTVERYSFRYSNISNIVSSDSLFLSPDDFIVQSFFTEQNSEFIDVFIHDIKNYFVKDNTFPMIISFSFNGKDYFPIQVDSKNIFADSDWLRLPIKSFMNENNSRDKKELWLKFQNTSRDHVIEFTTSFCTETSSHFLINDSPENKTLILRSVSTGNSYYYFAFWILMFVFGSLFCWLCKGISVRSYLLIAIPFGLLCVFYSAFPYSLESSASVLSFNYLFAPSFFSINKESWMPSGILNNISFLNCPSALFLKDYGRYDLPFGILLPLMNWIFVPVLFAAKVFALSDVATVFSARLYALAICLILNSVAIHMAKNNKAIIFTAALVPFAFYSSFITTGIALAIFNLLLAFIFSGCESYAANTPGQINILHTIMICILLFIISVYNPVLGAIALFSMFYMNALAFKKNRKTGFIVSNAISFCLSLVLNISYLILNKESLTALLDPINSGLTLLFDNPSSALTDMINGLSSVINNVLIHCADNAIIPILIFLLGIIIGALIFIYSKSHAIFRIERISLNEDFTESMPGASLTVVSAVLLALICALSIITGILSRHVAYALICPITAFLASSVCFRSNYSSALYEEHMPPFIIMIFVSVSLVSRMLPL